MFAVVAYRDSEDITYSRVKDGRIKVPAVRFGSAGNPGI